MRDLATSPRESFPALRRRIGTVFQDFRLLDHLSALDNVALPLRVAGVREDQIQQHVSELLNWVGLADHIHAKPATLSGGQQQRVAIARAVIARPKLLLADEPTGKLDDDTGERVMELVTSGVREQNATLLYVTHSLELASRADSILEMHSGVLARKDGKAAEAAS